VQTTTKRIEVGFNYYRLGIDMAEIKRRTFDGEMALKIQVANLRRSASRLKRLANELTDTNCMVLCEGSLVSLILEDEKAKQLLDLKIACPAKRRTKFDTLFDEIDQMNGGVIND
jgi:hypothetical protein